MNPEADKKRQQGSYNPTDMMTWKLKKSSINRRMTSMERFTKMRTKRTKTTTSQSSRNRNYKLRSTVSKEGKTRDTKGIKAEDLKECDDETKEMMRTVYNEIIKHETLAWKLGKTW